MKTDSDSLQQEALEIWSKGVDAVRPEPLLQRAFMNFPPKWLTALRTAPTIQVVGGGKAGLPMVHGLVAALGEFVPKLKGIVNIPAEEHRRFHGITLHAARPIGSNHPTVDGVAGTEQMMELLASAGPEDVAICLLSGGGSALLPAPVPGVTLEDKQFLTKALHECGATISEMNTVRKHLSRVKGGRLAEHYQGKLFISLIISDVVGDPLDVIASGPTVPDPTTYADALEVLHKYKLHHHIPAAITNYLLEGKERRHPETLKQLPAHVQNLLIGSNQLAIESALQVVRPRGYNILNLGSRIEGEAREVGIVLAGLVQAIQHRTGPVEVPACIIFGGETTVMLGTSPGRGGRNQELVLSLLHKLGKQNLPGVCILCAGTDGEDGPTDAAGAMGSSLTLEKATKLELNLQEYLSRHDSYRFFQQVDHHVKTGLTGTNVMDLGVILITQPASSEF